MKFQMQYFALLLLFVGSSCHKPARVEERLLTENWSILSSKKTDLDGIALSNSTNLDLSNWVKTSVPTTVMGALVEAGVIKDPFFGKNLENIPKTDFQDPWWFRTTFDLKGFDAGFEVARLQLDGINYRANIYLNGVLISAKDTIYGAFRQFDLNISAV